MSVEASFVIVTVKPLNVAAVDPVFQSRVCAYSAIAMPAAASGSAISSHAVFPPASTSQFQSSSVSSHLRISLSAHP